MRDVSVLPHLQADLARLKLERFELRRAIVTRRAGLRWHRDQKGDDRCWLDDYRVWGFVWGLERLPETKILVEQGMKRCREFFNNRRAPTADPMPPDAILDPSRWDEDIAGASPERLLRTLIVIQNEIHWHGFVSKYRPLTVADDRRLYQLLPEKVPADFRLPPEDEFLGKAKVGAGCPNFWESHAACKAVCDFHAWGPCQA